MAKAFSDKAPRTYLSEVAPGPAGIEKPTQIMFFDYMLWAGKDVSDDAVYKVAKAMYENEGELHGLGPLWSTHKSATMGKNQDMPYHPGADEVLQRSRRLARLLTDSQPNLIRPAPCARAFLFAPHFATP